MLECAVHAQSIERQVIGSAGTYHYQGSAGSLSFTVGEAATSTLVSPGDQLTQGFQQPVAGDFPTILSTNSLPLGIAVYPNPVHDLLFVRDTEGRNLVLSVQDALGRRVPVELNAFGPAQSIDVQHLARGSYVLTIMATSGERWTITFIKQ